MFRKIADAGALNRKQMEAVYEMVAVEIEQGDVKKGLWAQALVKSEGDQSKAEAAYLKLRVQAILDDKHLLESVFREFSNPIPKPPVQEEQAEVEVPDPPPERDDDSNWKWRCDSCGGAVKANYGSGNTLICKYCAYKNA